MAGTIGKLRSKLPKVESMHPLSERDRAKKDYGKVELIIPITSDAADTIIKKEALINMYERSASPLTSLPAGIQAIPIINRNVPRIVILSGDNILVI